MSYKWLGLRVQDFGGPSPKLIKFRVSGFMTISYWWRRREGRLRQMEMELTHCMGREEKVTATWSGVGLTA